MSTRDRGEDAAFFLYLVPIIASIVYGGYEWFVIDSTSHAMPIVSYLIVSKDPYLFLGSLVAICLGVVVEVRGADWSERRNLVLANSTRMQILAVVVLIISFAAALSTAGYSDLGDALTTFLRGAYAMIFAFFLLLVSILLSPSLLFGRAKPQVALAELVGMICLGFSPLTLYLALKLRIPLEVAALVPVIVLIIGIALILGRNRMAGRTKIPRQAAKSPATS